METLTIHQTKTNLSALLKKVDKGGSIVFGERGRPEYKITRMAQNIQKRRKAYGMWRGKAVVGLDAFSEETDRAIWKGFYESLDKE